MNISEGYSVALVTLIIFLALCRQKSHGCASTIAGADIFHDRIRPDVKKISEPEKSATVTLNTPPSQICRA